MRRTLILLGGLLVCAACQVATEPADRPVVLAESFEGDVAGWRLVLNRGAEGDMAGDDGGVLGSRCARITPRSLNAPDDRQLSTNVHLRYETLELRAGTPYVLSAWLRSDGRRPLRIKVRRNSVEESVSSGPMEIGPTWKRFEFAFALPIDYPDGVPQILLGDSTRPVWIDAVTIAEAPAVSLAPADYVTFAQALAGPSASLVRFVSDFEDETHAWQLRLNRGAEAELACEDGNLCVTPSALSAPTDQQYPTNVHLYAPTVSLRAGIEYVFSARLRSDGPRAASLRLRAADGPGTVGGPEFEVGETWGRHEWTFTLDEDMPEAVPQVLAGYDLRPLWIDDVILAEAGVGDEPPEGCVARGRLWLRPEVVAGDVSEAGPLSGLVELATDLPDSVRVHLAVDMFAADGLRLMLGTGDAPNLAIDIAGDGVTVGDARHEISPAGWRAGEAVTLTLERLDSASRLIVGETLELALPATDFTRAWIGSTTPGQGVRVLAAEGYEMLPTERPDGSTERQEFADPITGRRVVRLTHSPFNDKHAYYDISPWSPDGSRIAFSSALPGTRDAAIHVMDADGTDIRTIAEGDSFSMHTGAFPIWAPDGRSIYYHTHFEDDGGARVSGTARVWLETGEIDHIPLGARQVSWATGRLLWMENGRDEDDPVRGLYSAAPDGGGVTLLCRTADIEALSPTREMHDRCAQLGLTNCKWSPDGSKVMVVLVGYDGRGSQLVKEIYIADADGGDLRFVMTFAHHHIWHPNSEQVIGNCADGLYIVNADGTGRRKITELAQGHPSFSPDGSMIVTDCYGGEHADMLVLIDAETGAVEPLCSVPTVHGRSHETGTHPHPCWSPDGRSVLYDSDQEGHCQLYQVFLD